MKRIRLIWLFFFCMFVCIGCMSRGEQNKEEKVNRKEEQDRLTTQENMSTETENVETLAGVENESEEFIVLIDGSDILTQTAAYICDKMDTIYYNISNEWKEEQYKKLAQADYVVIGTDKNLLEFEFSFRTCIGEEMLQGKKVALFLICQEEAQDYEEKILEWYPQAELLPSFTMDEDIDSFEEELGRVNGWLTTILNYDRNIE